MKKTISIFLSALIITLCFCSCGNPGADGDIVLPIDNEPEYLDPQIISDESARLIMSNCMEGLMEYDTSGNLVPAGAESYEVSSDGKTYTFNLRKEAVWRVTTKAGAILGDDYAETFDTSVTANDYVFAFQRAVSPETECPYIGLFENILNAEKIFNGSLSCKKLGVYAEDDYTLVIRLERADADFLAATTCTAAFPCNEEFFNATGGRYGLTDQYLIYNGPFFIYNWAEGTSISMRRNYLYHSLGDSNIKDEVKPATLYFSFNNEQSTRAGKLKDETYQIASLSESQSSSIEDSKKVNLNAFENVTTSLIFNCADEYTSNSNLRKSLAYSLDYSILEDYGTRAESLIPGSLIIGDSNVENLCDSTLLKNNKKKAGSLFSAALTELDLQTIDLTILCDEENETFVRTLIQSWQKLLGVIFNISVEACDSATLESRVESGDYQIALYDLKFTGTFAKTALDMFTSTGRNNIFSSSYALVDSLVGDCYTAGSQTKTASAVTEAENHILSQAIVIPLLSKTTSEGVYSKCSSPAFNPTGEIAYLKSVLYN